MTETRMAPLHRWQGTGTTGIEWTPKEVRLWEYDAAADEVRCTLTGTHETRSEWEFFYHFACRSAFPGVSHWWIHSPWTQRVMVDRWGATDPNTLRGGLSFVSEEQGGYWEITAPPEGGPAEVFVTLPEHESRANSALVLALGTFVVLAALGEVPEEAWHLVTSLVPAEAGILEATFPETPYMTNLTQGDRWWTLPDLGFPSIRHWMLAEQGLYAPKETPTRPRVRRVKTQSS